MGRKAKYSQIIKVRACEDYLSVRKSAAKIAKELNAGKNGSLLICRWSKKYQNYGPSIFEETHSNRRYSKEFKEQIVHEYLKKSVSYEDLIIKYNISSISMIAKWVLKYTKGEENKEYNPLGGVYTMPRVKTPYEKRIEIVNYCIENNKDYKGTALKYGVSYA